MARQVVTRSYCLHPDIIKWINDLAIKKQKKLKRRISASEILNDILIEAKNNKPVK